MTKVELNMLVEKIISIRDRVEMSWQDKDTLADAAITIYHNIDMIREYKA